MTTCAQCQQPLADDATSCPACGAAVEGADSTKIRRSDSVLLEGKWALQELIGKGGMGSVYKAHDSTLDRTVAIKLLSASLSTDPDFVARFGREAKMMARLEHTNLMPIYAVGVHDGSPFLVMKFLEGQTLEEYARDRGELPIEELLAITRQLCAGLGFVHASKVIHRDIKPANVFISPDGHVTILDLGLVRTQKQEGAALTRGLVVGTPGYMAPEQSLGAKDIDHRADLYSVGVMLYELFTGFAPHRADSALALLIAHQIEPVPDAAMVSPRVTPAVSAVLAKAMAKQAKDRFDSAGELLKALEAACREPAASVTMQALDPPAPDPRPSASGATRPGLRDSSSGQRPRPSGVSNGSSAVGPRVPSSPNVATASRSSSPGLERPSAPRPSAPSYLAGAPSDTASGFSERPPPPRSSAPRARPSAPRPRPSAPSGPQPVSDGIGDSTQAPRQQELADGIADTAQVPQRRRVSAGSPAPELADGIPDTAQVPRQGITDAAQQPSASRAMGPIIGAALLVLALGLGGLVWRASSAPPSEVTRVPEAVAIEAPPAAPPHEQVPEALPAPVEAPEPEDSPTAAPEPTRPVAEPAKPALVHVSSTPAMTVFVDSKARGQTPLEVAVSSGSHTVVLKNAELGLSKTLVLRLASGEKKAVEWAPARAKIVVHVDPFGKIAIDGKVVKAGSSIAEEEVWEGHHTVVASIAEPTLTKTLTRQIDVAGGATAEVRFNMQTDEK